MSKGGNSSVQVAGSVLQAPCHACAFFSSREEEHRVLLPFVKEGVERGERILQLLDRDREQERRQLLQDNGIDVEAAKEAIDFVPWESAYLRDGRFEIDSMLGLVDEVLSNSKDRGFGLTRGWANMEWALTDLPGVDGLVEYETRVNAVVNRFDFVVICTYDVTQFSAAMVMDVMRTHPMVILGGTLQINPFYVPAPQFLEELRGRRPSTHMGC